MVEQRTHKPSVVGSNPTPATTIVIRLLTGSVPMKSGLDAKHLPPTAATKMKEIEAKFLEINPAQIQTKLKKLGAKKIFDKTFREAIYCPPRATKEYDKWLKERRRVRIRDTGEEVLLAIKVNKKWGLSDTEEVEQKVASFEETEKFLKLLGLALLRYQEKRRISYQVDGAHIEVDYWPWVPTWLEIEAESEKKVKDWAQKLDLDWEQAEFRDAAAVYDEVYNIDIFNLDRVAFDLPDPRK